MATGQIPYEAMRKPIYLRDEPARYVKQKPEPLTRQEVKGSVVFCTRDMKMKFTWAKFVYAYIKITYVNICLKTFFLHE